MSDPYTQDNLDWLVRNLPDLRKRYDHQWVAIVNGNVIASNESLAGLIRSTPADTNPFITWISDIPVDGRYAFATK